MKKFPRLFLFGLILIGACSKDDPSALNPLVGTWVFTNREGVGYPYPSILTGDQLPIYLSASSQSGDSIKITFENSSNYAFWNFHLPVDYGTYKIVQDSFIVIKPDTAGFVKFNFLVSSFFTGSVVQGEGGIPPIIEYAPYAGIHYFTDTLVFRRPTAKSVVFLAGWVTKAGSGLSTTKDTLILNQSLSYFEKR